MAVTVLSFSIFQTKVGTNHILSITSSPGVYVFQSSCKSMRAGDVVEFLIQTAIASGEPIDTAFFASFAGSQYDPIKLGVPLTTAHTASFLTRCGSSGLAGSGVGSNGPQIGWTLLRVN